MPVDPRLSHLGPDGAPRMVDVGDKADTERVAVAEGRVRLSAAAEAALASGATPKGDVLQIARLAGIQGAKHTALLIPLCHPLPLDAVEVEVRTRWRTGVEMEALAAVSAACLTVVDMLKGVDRGLVIDGLRVVHKRGGRGGAWGRDPGVDPGAP
jgi:cyclic pyranopterin phosphate synthase